MAIVTEKDFNLAEEELQCLDSFRLTIINFVEEQAKLLLENLENIYPDMDATDDFILNITESVDGYIENAWQHNQDIFDEYEEENADK